MISFLIKFNLNIDYHFFSEFTAILPEIYLSVVPTYQCCCIKLSFLTIFNDALVRKKENRNERKEKKK